MLRDTAPAYQCERPSSEQTGQKQEGAVDARCRFSEGKINIQTILGWVSVSEVILSYFNTWLEIKTMTAAPSAPATAMAPWLASLCSDRKPILGEKPRRALMGAQPYSSRAARVHDADVASSREVPATAPGAKMRLGGRQGCLVMAR